MPEKVYLHDIDLDYNFLKKFRLPNLTDSEITALGATLDADNSGYPVWNITQDTLHVWDGTQFISTASGIIDWADIQGIPTLDLDYVLAQGNTASSDIDISSNTLYTKLVSLKAGGASYTNVLASAGLSLSANATQVLPTTSGTIPVTVNNVFSDISGNIAITTDNVSEGSSNLYYLDSRARAAISETITGINYNNTTGVFSLTSGYVIPTTTQESNWTTAYDKRIVSTGWFPASGDFRITFADSTYVDSNLNGRYSLLGHTHSTSDITDWSTAWDTKFSNKTTDDLNQGATNKYFTDSLARGAISETITGIDYNNTTGVFSLTSGYVIPTTTEETNWNTAYGWGNHASAGYLTTSAAALAYQPLDSDLTTIAGLTATTDNFIVSVSNAWASRTPAEVKTTLSLNNVENTALSTWTGSTNITTLGTITTGTWTGSVIGASYLPTASADGSTKGVATFTAADFDSSLGVISIDYANGQKASASVSGFVSTTTQTFAGAKTFSSDITVNSVKVGRGGGSISTNTTVGSGAQNSTATGGFNVWVGAGTGAVNTSGQRNTGIGYQALNANVSGSSNVAIGQSALTASQTGDFNIAIGRAALFTSNGYSDNVAIGYQSMINLNGGSQNVGVGTDTLKGVSGSTTCTGNVAVGYQVLMAITTGARNCSSGYQSSSALTSASECVAIGTYSLLSNQTGDQDVAVGTRALQNCTGYLNTAVGYGAGKNLTSGNNCTYLGGFDGTGFTTSSNYIFISDGAGNVRLMSDNSGLVGVGTTAPTARLHVKATNGYNQFRLETSYTPSSTADANGNIGDFAWDDSYIYVKTTAGWKRSALNTF